MKSRLAFTTPVVVLLVWALPLSSPSFAVSGSDALPERGNRVTYEPALSEDVRAIERTLDRKLDLRLERMPLMKAVDELRTRTRLPLEIDEASLRRARIPFDIPIAVNAKKVPLGDALATALRRVRLAYTVDDDQLLVLSIADADERLVTRQYALSPLAWTKLERAELLDKIQQELPDAAWEQIDGVGGWIRIDGKTGRIEVRQTYIVHQKLRRLLKEAEEEASP